MDKNLNIELTVANNCSLWAIDKSNYTEAWGSDVNKHVAVEFLLYNQDTTVSPTLIKTFFIQSQQDIDIMCSGSSFMLPKDGNWHYYKMIIPHIDHFYDADTNLYNVRGECFYYEGKFYLCSSDLDTPISSIEQVLSKVEPTTD